MPRPAVLAIAVLLAACTPAADDVQSGESPAPGKLIAWSTESIRVFDRPGTMAGGNDLDTAGFRISQVTPSPDGRVAWTAFDDATSTYRTMVSPTSEGRGTEISVPTAPFFYAWNPTADRLAFLGNDPGGAGVLFGSLDPETGIAEPHGIATPFFLDWAPDGASVIANIGAATLGVIEVPGGDVTDTGMRPGPAPAPIWTTDGVLVVALTSPTVQARLTAVSFQTGQGQVRHLDPSTGERSTLMEVDAPVRIFATSDGHRLAAVTGEVGDQRLSILDRTGAILAERSGPSIEFVQWSPDGDALLYTMRSTEVRERTPYVWLVAEDADVSFDPFVPSAELETTYLPFWDQYDRALSVWAPDSSLFVLATEDGVRLQSLEGGIEELEGFTMAVFAPPAPAAE